MRSLQQALVLAAHTREAHWASGRLRLHGSRYALDHHEVCGGDAEPGLECSELDCGACAGAIHVEHQRAGFGIVDDPVIRIESLAPFHELACVQRATVDYGLVVSVY